MSNSTKVGAKPGSRHRRERPEVAPQREALEPDLVEAAPLFSTYDAPKPEGAYFDEEAADRRSSGSRASCGISRAVGLAGRSFCLLGSVG